MKCTLSCQFIRYMQLLTNAFVAKGSNPKLQKLLESFPRQVEVVITT